MTEPNPQRSASKSSQEPAKAAPTPATYKLDGRAKRSYSRHGLNALKARVKVRGLHALDRRTAAAQALLVWCRELMAALGGESAISPQQRAIVELAARTRLYIDSLDAWLMMQSSMINGRRRSVLPALAQRQTLADSFLRHLQGLGLERKAKAGMRPAKLSGRTRIGGRSEVNVIEAVRDQNLFGRWFRTDTWAAWLVFLSALFALPMTREQISTFSRLTGRTTPPREPAREAWVIA